MPELVESVVVEAAPEQVWAALVRWDLQQEWMLFTRVRGTVQDGQGVGGGIEAWTGLGPLGFTDTMTVTGWDPPERCVVRHTGRIVRGGGAFEVLDLGGGRSRFVWSEFLDLPLGVLGRLGWPLLRPVARAGLAFSLRRFRRYVENSA